MGNLSFVWKVHATDESDSAFSNSQSVIESVKQSIPVFHTRAMRRNMLQKFGRLTSTANTNTGLMLYITTSN